MKKLLVILGAMSLATTVSISAVACTPKVKEEKRIISK
ncbi:lipoprotein, partial [Mesoplasma syrphidae]